ncbi:pro-neuregulin-4, membrane-bound isoform-like [Engraulis encrasicolus]|uniref:pro-neuregulin-4, membrane-bound isoform-like n=1 Tax=Engraulis encrasicolus TaxID=184585 RepID=UPI002FD2B62B
MMADHGDPCGAAEASYCMNGGSCYKIPTVSTPTCVCSVNYQGSRCEEFQLPSTGSDGTEAGMIAGVVIIILIFIALMSAVIYYGCKLKKSKEPKQPKTEEYWKIPARASSV